MAVRRAGKISELSPRELGDLRLIVAGRLKHKLSTRSGMDLMPSPLTWVPELSRTRKKRARAQPPAQARS